MTLPHLERADQRPPEHDDTWSKLTMEADLLWRGSGAGLKNGCEKIIDKPGEALTNLALVAGSSYAFSIACQLGGARFSKATQIALGLALAYDLGSRAINSVSAMSDVWHEPEHFEQAKKAIADNVGEGLFDYALNGAVSAGAFHMAYGKISRSEMLQKAARNAYMIAKDRTATTVPVRINELLFENQTLPEDSPLRLLWEKTKDSVVRLDGMKPRRSSGGSGFFVSEDGLAVTNYHVIKEMKNPTVLTEQGQKFAVKLVARDKFNDLALVRVTNAPPGTVFSAASIDTAGGIGTPVAVIGYPGEFGAKVVEPGEVVGSSAWKRMLSTSPFLDLEPRANWYLRGLGKMGEQKHFYKPKRLERNASGIPYIRRENLQHSALATAGNSGSPVFDMNGKVIGIHSNGGGTSINARHLEAMLKQTQLTPPGDGWLDISSHLEPAGSSPSTPKILSAKIRDRWSLASSLRADLKATITAENRAQWRELRVRRVRSSAAVAGIDARIHSLISPPKEDEPW